jgi:Family of unknown function (DUF6492)
MRFAIVTPSYHLDHERCLLLSDSIAKYVPQEIEHHIIVSRSDYALFKGRADRRTHVVVQEDIVQGQFWRLPWPKNSRIGWMTLPIRGWIWQQMVKLSIAAVVDADAYMFIDSDIFFVRPCDPRSFVVDGKVPLLREDKDWYETSADHQKWAAVSRRLLRLPRSARPWRVGYVGPGPFWRRDVLEKLQSHLSRGRGGAAWLRRIARRVTFSEYMLYGIFVDEVLGMSAAGHYGFGRHLCHEFWDARSLSREELALFRRTVPEDRVLAMVSARGATAIADVRAAFEL